MADFIVLEEDGTSHLETEESSDDLVTEESVGATTSIKAGFAVAGTAGSGVGPPTPVPSRATWQVGTLTVPSSTGTHAVTGLGGTPAAVFFFGTNWLTEDTSVTTAGTGIFRGVSAPSYTSPGTLVNYSHFVRPAGAAHLAFTLPIIALDAASGSSTTNLYAADVTSLDTDGFTLDWQVAASGGYKVVYAALMDVQNVGSYFGAGTTISLGFKAGSALVQGHNGGATSLTNTSSAVWYGSTAYPGTGGGGSWYAAGLTAYAFPASASSQYLTGLENQAPGTIVSEIGDFIGPFLSPQNATLIPTGGGLTDLTLSTPASSHFSHVTAWDDEDSRTGRNTPATSAAGTTTITGLPFTPGLVLGYSLSDEPSQLGSNAGGATAPRGAVGFSVATPDFQWCALIDGVDRGAFQSFQRGFVDTVHNSNVHAGTIQLTSDGFVMTTAQDAVGPNPWVWHAFGHPHQVPTWIPQSYRRRNKP